MIPAWVESAKGIPVWVGAAVVALDSDGVWRGGWHVEEAKEVGRLVDAAITTFSGVHARVRA